MALQQQAGAQIDVSLINDNGLQIPLNEHRAQLELADLTKNNNRTHKLRDNFHSVVVVLMWTICIAFIACVAVRVVLFFVPDNYVWLSKERLSLVDSLFTHTLTGGLGIYAGKYLQERL
jgi:hypothetical protein